MTPELAQKLQKLKDAGIKTAFYSRDRKSINPTLSELIEACGEEFYGVHTTHHGYKAYGGKIDSLTDEGFGSTPEEAVANLWLELHEKSH